MEKDLQRKENSQKLMHMMWIEIGESVIFVSRTVHMTGKSVTVRVVFIYDQHVHLKTRLNRKRTKETMLQIWSSIQDLCLVAPWGSQTLIHSS